MSKVGVETKRFYVKSWGRDKKQVVIDRVGATAPARFLCMTKQDDLVIFGIYD